MELTKLMVDGANLESERAGTIAGAIRQNSNLARAIEEHSIRTIKGVDAAARFIELQYAQFGAKLNLAKYVADGLIDGALAISIGVTNEQGDVVANTEPL